MHVANVRTQQDVLIDIAEKLDTVLGFLAVRGMEGDPGKMVIRLNDMGLSRKCIAQISGVTENAIEIRLRRMKRPKAKSGKSVKGGKSSKMKTAAATNPVPVSAETLVPSTDSVE